MLQLPDRPIGVALATDTVVRFGPGHEVHFDDGLVAQVAANGLWHDTLGLPLAPARTIRSTELRHKARALAGRRLGHVQLAPVSGRPWVPDLTSRLAQQGLIPSAVAAWLGIDHRDGPAEPVIVLWAHVGRTPSGRSHPIRLKLRDLDDAASAPPVSLLALDPAPVFGSSLLDHEVIARTLRRLAGPRTLLAVDESNALLRNGRALTYPNLAIEPDLLRFRLGGLHQEGIQVFAWSPSLSAAAKLSVATTSPPRHEQYDSRLGLAMDLARSPAARSASLATADELADGLHRLVSTGQLSDIVGSGWAWALTPARAARLQPHLLAERLRRAQVWAPVTQAGRILVLPSVMSTSGDVVRLVDGVEAALSTDQQPEQAPGP